MKHARHLTPAEFEIMEVLWECSGSLSVAEVLERIRQGREVAYTTIMTLLDKMASKGSVRRRKRGKAYLYQPRVTRAQVLDYLISDFTRQYCGGDKGRLLDHLGESSNSKPQTSNVPATVEEELDVSLL